jgi:hypothetical protein
VLAHCGLQIHRYDIARTALPEHGWLVSRTRNPTQQYCIYTKIDKIEMRTTGLRILIVEGRADIRRLMRMTLEVEEHETHEAFNADAKVEATRRRRPDWLLTRWTACCPAMWAGWPCIVHAIGGTAEHTRSTTTVRGSIHAAHVPKRWRHS